MRLRFLLDTCILSEPVMRRPNPDVMTRILRHGHEVATAAPAWHEITYGCRRLAPSRKRTLIEDYLAEIVASGLPVLAYDIAAAAWHAAERARLERAGAVPSFVDGQIAAVAHSQGLVLVTRNVTDFQNFAGLRVENWFERA
ncbi:MAG: type II toxin-antitoxin system VapC family toxin [Actinobacteria bacterium]|nr:type II toxin-antitoxin system VapC family toxin [Actinomycetota bacterium]